MDEILDDTIDAFWFAKFINDSIDSLRVSENQLIYEVRKVNENDLESMANNYFGVDFKRLLHTYILGERKGDFLRNNLQKEFVRAWIFKNRMSEISSNANLVDSILGRKATDEEIIIASSVIQWIGTNVGLDFIMSVINNNKIE